MSGMLHRLAALAMGQPSPVHAAAALSFAAAPALLEAAAAAAPTAEPPSLEGVAPSPANGGGADAAQASMPASGADGAAVEDDRKSRAAPMTFSALAQPAPRLGELSRRTAP